jgi:ribosomal protein L20A (L18A)
MLQWETYQLMAEWRGLMYGTWPQYSDIGRARSSSEPTKTHKQASSVLGAQQDMRFKRMDIIQVENVTEENLEAMRTSH